MKRRYALCFLLFLLFQFPFYAQTQNQPVTAGVPAPVAANSSYHGTQGFSPIYYYVCSIFPAGFVCPSSPSVASGTAGIAALGGSNTVTINWAPGSVGATGYEVMRFAAPGFSGSCSSCVIAAVTGTSYVDSSPSTPAGSFPPGGLAQIRQAGGEIRLDNRDYQSPGLVWALGGSVYPFALVPTNATPGDCVTFLAQPPFLADIPCSGTGGISQLTKDVLAGPGLGSQAATVVGIDAVPLCTGFSPANGQVLQYTTGSTPNPCYTAGTPSGGSVTGSGTATHLSKWTSSTALGNGDFTDNGAYTAANTEPFSLTVVPGLQQFANSAAGTVVNSLSKVVNVGGVAEVKQIATTDTKNVYGVCVLGCGTTGNAQIAFMGQALCIFDGAAGVGDWAEASTTVAGDCHDDGNAEPNNGGQILGRILTAAAGAGNTAVVDMYSPDSATAGGIRTLTQDVTAGPGNGSVAATVVGLETVPFCTGYTPTNGEAVTYTTGGTPNPCYSSVTPAGGVSSVAGTTNEVGVSPTTGAVVVSLTNPETLPGTLNVPNGAANFGQTGTASSVGLYTADGNEVVWSGGATGVNATETWTFNPTANGQVPTSSSCTGNNCTITWAVPSGGSVTSVAAGAGLSAAPSPITSTGTVSCQTSSATQIGCAEPDNSTIKATAGVYAAQNTTINGTACTPGGSCTVTVTGPFHQAGATFSGGGVQTTQVFCCYVAANAGTIKSWDITVDDGTGAGTCAGCTCTVKFWKIATGTATPTSANSINTSGVSLSTGTAVHSSTVTDFTTLAVVANDIIAVQLSAVANASVVVADFQFQ